MNYFKKVAPLTATDLHKAYREQSKILHPDKDGGDFNKFVEMQNQYRDLLYFIDNEKLPVKPQSVYYRNMMRDTEIKPKQKVKPQKVRNTDLNAVLKKVLKSEIKKRVRKKKHQVKRGQTIYIVDLNKIFNGFIDKFL